MSLENGQVTAEAQAFFDAVFQVIQNNPDAEVDWEDRVFEQLENEKLKCIHKMNKNTDENSLYNALLSTFHDNTGNWLFIRNDSIPNDLATTKGSFLNSIIPLQI